MVDYTEDGAAPVAPESRDCDGTISPGGESLVNGEIRSDVGDEAECAVCQVFSGHAKRCLAGGEFENLGEMRFPRKRGKEEDSSGVWIDLRMRNDAGHLRWYSRYYGDVGFVVVVDDDKKVEALRAFRARDGDGDAPQDGVTGVVRSLAFGIRFGDCERFCKPPRDFDGVVACSHFRDIRGPLQKSVEDTLALMDELASRR